MLLLFAGAAVAGLYILPGEAERVAMLERDGQNERARAMLEQGQVSGHSAQRSLYQLEQLYAHFGDLSKARITLEKLAEERPRDIVLQRRLARYYRDTQDTDAYLAALSRLVSRRYTEATCRELVGQLRFVGQFAREREAIERCRLKGYRRPEDLVRLAELEAVDGDAQRAASLLRALDDAGRLPGTYEKLLFASLLIDRNESAEVERRAVAWIGDLGDKAVAQPLIDLLRRRGAEDVGIEIARKAGEAGDALTLSVAELMLSRDQTSAAQAYLRGWLARAALHDNQLVSRFIELALEAEDPEVALTAAQRIGLQNLAEPQLVAIAESLGAQGRRSDFEAIRSALSADTLVSHPLLAAMVELNRGQSGASRELISKVDVDGLESWRLALWARLMRDTGRGAAARAKLRALGITRQSHLHRYARPRYASRLIRRRRARTGTAIATGSVDSGAAVEQAVRPHRSKGTSLIRLRKKVIRKKASKVSGGLTTTNRSGGSGQVARPGAVVRPKPTLEW